VLPARKFSSIVVLTGAGISAESGIRTFRAADGLWENHRIEDVATPEAFARNPKLVHQFYNLRRAQLKEVEPNAAHLALAELERKFRGECLVVTQNVDDLHDRTGQKNLLHMHGELKKIFCGRCGWKMEWTRDLTSSEPCPECEATESLRPDIVWFGEVPYHMDAIIPRLQRCDLFVSIGTSSNVYPAAGFVELAQRAVKVEINLEPTVGAHHFTTIMAGKASEQVPNLVRQILTTD